MILFGAIGGAFVITSFAATPYALAQLSSASTGNGASIATNTQAIDGKMIIFNGNAPTTSTSSSSPQTAAKTTPTSSTSSAASNSTHATSTSSSTPSGSSSGGSNSGGNSTPQSCVYTTTSSQTSNGQYDWPSSVPYIIGAASNPWVGSNIWSNNSAYNQTLCEYTPANWYVSVNVNTNFGGVQAYPNTGFNMDGAVDSSKSVTSSWNVTIPTDNTKTAGWAAYDLWFNSWADEVMIQTDLTANSYYDCTAEATATFSGMPWHLCVFGSERVWKPGTDDQHMLNQASGSVDVLAMLEWMEQNGYLPQGSTWTAGSFGFEVCDTEGNTQTFEVNNFTWDAQ
ncbi:MAG TPA: hypothetical protein VMB52_05495 [Verrucomicrobiae bacterium]|nr:hypothetical protein [Verrucomicrobiae bacterium]